MNEDLEKENRLLRRQLKTFIDQARQNEEKMRRFQSVELRMISVSTLCELVETIFKDYKKAFSLDALTLVLIDPQKEIQHFLAEDGLELSQYPDLLFATNQEDMRAFDALSLFPVLGDYKPRQHADLFPNTRPRPATIAIIPLVRHGKIVGSMNLGSYSPGRFINGAATDFLERIAAIAAVSFENTLNHERLKHMGLTDPLTRINNRRFFDQRLHEEVSRAHRNNESLSCLFLDVDHFKRINDNHGHQIGDFVLSELASLLELQMRSSDVLARYGGEEFAALLSNTSSEEALEIAERIRRKVGDKTDLGITLSIGVATLQPNGEMEDINACGARLVGHADRALLTAKESGRNRVVCVGNIQPAVMALKIVHADP